MPTKTLSALAAATALLTAGFALADDRPGAGWITIEKAIQAAKDKGYVEVYKVEADDDGYWKGDGRKADGLKYEFRIDGTSGNVLRDQKD